MWRKPRATGIWAVLVLLAWVVVYVGGPLRLIVAAGFFVFLGSFIPIAVFRVIEGEARRKEPGVSAQVVIGLCLAGKIVTVLGLIWLVMVILRAYEMVWRSVPVSHSSITQAEDSVIVMEPACTLDSTDAYFGRFRKVKWRNLARAGNLR
jgi:hypothetical protein